MIAQDILAHNPQALHALADQLHAYVRDAAAQGAPAHQAERAILQHVLDMGRAALGLFFRLQGSGDLGDTLPLPDGPTADRLDDLHHRDYRSIFGDFDLQRAVYGSREGQKILFVPLDARLQLPDGDYSYLLQQWDMALGVESAFGRVAATLHDILGLKQPVDSLERMSRHMAEYVGPFRESRPRPPADEEQEVVVTQADGKGVVIRRAAGEPKIHGHRKKGQKANKKRMATVGTLYTVARVRRTAEEVVASLFRDPQEKAKEKKARPAPVHKHVWASLSYERDGAAVHGPSVVFGWLRDEQAARNPDQAKETVYLMDGQESLWDACEEFLPSANAVGVLDLLHVTPRLWEAAHLFCKEGSAEAEAFLRERLLRVLRGEVRGVVSGLRRLGTLRGLSGAKRQRLSKVCSYLAKNAGRMRYDDYLAKGYPIASGVIEGACRHYVKDRMERAGMHWTLAGAQALLDVRSEYLNGDWAGFQQYRIERETERLYPHRQILEGVQWALAV